MKVPLAYGPKQKFLTRLREDPNLNKKVSLTLPRIGFEISGISYDSSRKLNSIQKLKKVNNSTDGKTVSSQFMPVPYNMDFSLFVMAKSSDDALQIVEQILPFFQPDYTITLNDNTSMGTTRDVPIILNGVSYEDSYDGDFTERRVLMYTLTFTSKFYLYAQLQTKKLLSLYKLTNIQICLLKHLRENKDIQLHLHHQVQMQMTTSDLMKKYLSSKTQRILMKKLVQIKKMHK